MMRKVILFFILISTVIGAWADGITFTANAPEVVVSGDQFRLSYTINSQKVRDFRAPNIQGFEVLMGPSRSTQSSTQINKASLVFCAEKNPNPVRVRIFLIWCG